MTTTKTLYRAANDDILVDCGSFAADLDSARAYLHNPGYGGRTLYQTTVEVDDARVLDLYELGESDALDALCAKTGLSHPGAIGADEWAPRISAELRAAGVSWVRVRESYPEDSETWIYICSDDIDDPDLEEVSE